MSIQKHVSRSRMQKSNEKRKPVQLRTRVKYYSWTSLGQKSEFCVFCWFFNIFLKRFCLDTQKIVFKQIVPFALHFKQLFHQIHVFRKTTRKETVFWVSMLVKLYTNMHFLHEKWDNGHAGLQFCGNISCFWSISVETKRIKSKETQFQLRCHVRYCTWTSQKRGS